MRMRVRARVYVYMRTRMRVCVHVHAKGCLCLRASLHARELKAELARGCLSRGQEERPPKILP